MTGAAAPTGKKKHRWVPGVVVPALTALGLLLMATDFQGGDEKMLATLCQQVARDNALAPTTVQFADDARLTPQAPDLWTITGTMDSMNVFGAMLPTPYTCEATRSEDGMLSAKLLR